MSECQHTHKVLIKSITDPGLMRARCIHCSEIIFSVSGDVAKLYLALRLAKDMFIANDMSLPHTMEVIDEALTLVEGPPVNAAANARHTETN